MTRALSAFDANFARSVNDQNSVSVRKALDEVEMDRMIREKTGDIFAEDAEALVNPVNCVGVMGRGLALQFKKAFPDNFRAYAKACEHGHVRPGHMFVFETRQLTAPRMIINFPTKRHWRDDSRIEDIEAGLTALVEVICAHDIRSIAVPSLGCGLGGLDWRDVRPVIETALSGLDNLEVIIFEPRFRRHHDLCTRRPDIRLSMTPRKPQAVIFVVSEGLSNNSP